MDHPLAAPLTPELEAQIGTAPMVPITVENALQHFAGVHKYTHDASLLDMDLQPWRSTTFSSTWRGLKRQVMAAPNGLDSHPVADDAIVFVTRVDFERCTGHQQVAA